MEAARERGRGEDGARVAFLLAWSLAGLCVALFLANVPLYILIRSARVPNPLLALAVVTLLLAGLTVLALLGPGDPNFQRDPLDTYVDLAQDADRSIDLLYLVAVCPSLWYWFPLLGLIMIFTPLLFPEGRPPSPRWRPVVWAAGSVLLLVVFLAAFRERIEFPGHSIDNPVGIPGIGDPEKSRLGAVLFGFFIVFLVLALASVVVRYLRSGSVQRQQIKWLMLATLLAALMMFFEEITRVEVKTEVPFATSIALFPVAIAVAIFRYRLFDIDIINRALVYGVLTISLVLVYVGGVAGTQTAFRFLTGQDQQPQFAVVASTLAIAALFSPLRRRIQATIDRRFYRRKYDAAKTLEAYSARLRDETDLEALNDELLALVRETVQPEHISLWLRPPDRVAKS
jgi:hypothetical protein